MENAVKFLQRKYVEHIRNKFGDEVADDKLLEYEPPEWVVRAMNEFAVQYGRAIINLGETGIDLRQKIFRGEQVECSKEEYYNYIRDQLGNLAKDFLANDMFQNAKFSMDERQRLNEKFNFGEE